QLAAAQRDELTDPQEPERPRPPERRGVREQELPPTAHDARTLEVSNEVLRGEPGHLVERTRLLEEVRRTRHDHELRGAGEPGLRLAIELEDLDRKSTRLNSSHR